MNLQRVEVNLDDGRRLSCGCYIVSFSDRGAIMFTPSERATRNFIRVAENEGRKLFGDLPVVLVPPNITVDGERQFLPRYRFVGEFTSTPIDDSKCYSTAIVIWYQEGPYPVIGEDVESKFRLIDWNSVAIDQVFF